MVKWGEEPANPYRIQIQSCYRLQAGLTGITAAVVGVMLNLAVWFGHKVIWPNATVDFFALGSAIVSLVLLKRFHLPIHFLVPIAAVIGVTWRIVLQL